jgi:serine/threonine protein phosphatase PrpC
MGIVSAIRVVGREDRAAVYPRPEAFVAVIADGAGGVSGGAQAADGVLAAVRAAGVPGDATACAQLLAKLDVPALGGETTAVMVVLLPDRLIGASIGDSGAWMVTADGHEDLTEGQNRKPLLGTGRAVPVPFTRFHPRGTLLLATDGLLKYVPHARIEELARAEDVDAAAEELQNASRLPAGDWPDDVAVVVVRAG